MFLTWKQSVWQGLKVQPQSITHVTPSGQQYRNFFIENVFVTPNFSSWIIYCITPMFLHFFRWRRDHSRCELKANIFPKWQDVWRVLKVYSWGNSRSHRECLQIDLPRWQDVWKLVIAENAWQFLSFAWKIWTLTGRCMNWRHVSIKIAEKTWQRPRMCTQHSKIEPKFS